MAQHVVVYPCRLALMCTGQLPDTRAFIDGFAMGHTRSSKASEHAASSGVLDKLVEWPCFRTVVAQEHWGLVEQYLSVACIRTAWSANSPTSPAVAALAGGAAPESAAAPGLRGRGAAGGAPNSPRVEQPLVRENGGATGMLDPEALPLQRASPKLLRRVTGLTSRPPS